MPRSAIIAAMIVEADGIASALRGAEQTHSPISALGHLDEVSGRLGDLQRDLVLAIKALEGRR